MIFYRRNTFSDKVISFLCFLMMFVTGYDMYLRYQITDKVLMGDILLVIASFILGILFLSTFRFKYLEITDNEIIWYTWFVVKHRLTKEQIKEVAERKKNLILVKQRGEVWLSNAQIRDEDDAKVRELLRGFQK